MRLSPSRTRNYTELLAANQDVLRFLTVGGDPEKALKSSLDHLAQALDADFMLLLLMEGTGDGGCRRLHHRGLSDGQVRQCEQGKVEAAVAPALVRSVVAAHKSECTSGSDASAPFAADDGNTANDHVLCIPVLDPLRETAIAVICLRTPDCPYHHSATAVGWSSWFDGYAASLAHAFAYYFDKQRRMRPCIEPPGRGPRQVEVPELIGESSQTEALRRQLHEIYIPASDAPDPDPVLVLGEKGTGKDLVARYLHAYSRRRNRPLVVVNCAEISDELSASRFFGHRKGSFTGAMTDEAGFFRAADKGVLFLDEISELSLRAQATLLRVLENRTVVPVGETHEIAVDVQVVLATNRDPERAVDDCTLKADFLDRFRTQSICVDPLRLRVDDIPPLVRHFHARHERRTSAKAPGFTADAVKAMLSYSWPGNVRELSRVCSLLLTHARHASPVDRKLLFQCYPEAAKARRMTPSPAADGAPLRSATRTFQRELILARLEQHGWDARATRESLHLPKTTFQRYLAQVGISLAAVANGRHRE